MGSASASPFAASHMPRSGNSCPPVDWLGGHNPILLGKKIEQGFALVMSERNGPYYKKIELSRMLVLQAGMKEGFSAVTEVVLEIGDKTLFVHRQSQGRQMGVKALVSGRQGHSAIGL